MARAMVSWGRRSVLTALLLGWGACSNGGGSGMAESLASLGVDDGASAGETISALLKADAQTTLQLKTGARLNVPEGAVEDDVQVVLKRPPDPAALPFVKLLKSDYKVQSAPYVATPHGKEFSKEVLLSLPIAKGQSGEKLQVAYLEDESDKDWKIEGKPKVEGDLATIGIKHFSVYMLVEEVEEAQEPDASGEDASSSTEDAKLPTDDGDAGAGDGGADASISSGDAGTFAARLSARFTECGLVQQSGALIPGWSPGSKLEECALGCLLKASCPDVEAEFCVGQKEPQGFASCVIGCSSFGTVQCMTAAAGVQVVAVCNGEADCMDGSDEANCPADAFLDCSPSVGTRVPKALVCDGNEDCIDGSDEASCPSGTHFVCANGALIAANYQCDGASDCSDNSDEEGCSTFRCADGSQQVVERQVCDLSRDCSDGSDEDQGCLKLTCDPRADLGSGSVVAPPKP